MSIEREFFWIDTEKAIGVPKRVGLAGFGALVEICSQFYCGNLTADETSLVAKAIGCTEEEWNDLRPALIDAGEIAIRDGFIVPIGDWHKPVKDS